MPNLSVNPSENPSEYSDLDAAITAYLGATQETLTRFDDVPAADAAFNDSGILPHVREILNECDGDDTDALNFAITRLTKGLEIFDPYQAGRAAMLCGVLVERGGNPTIALPAILDRAPEFLRRTRELFEIMQLESAPIDDFYDDYPAVFARYFQAMPENVKAVRGLPLLLRPAMTMLCRDIPSRIAARQNTVLVHAVSDAHELQREAAFMHQVLQMTDDAPFLVLHAAHRKGFRVRVTGVQNNFHLFTLLQGALIGPGKLSGPTPDAEVIAVAKGEAQHSRTLNDSAAFGYFHYLGLRPDKTLDTVIGSVGWLWGEMPAFTTPTWENQHVILLDKLSLGSRGWNSGFFAPLHDALRSSVVIEEILSPEAVDNLITQLAQAAQQTAKDGGYS